MTETAGMIGYKLLVVPDDSIEQTAASRAAGEAYVAARHGGAKRTIMGPFEVIGGNGQPGCPDDPSDTVTVPRYHLDHLLAAATTYIEAFEPDEMMTLPGKMALQEMEAIVEIYGRRY